MLLGKLEDAASSVDESGNPASALLTSLAALGAVLEFLREDGDVEQRGTDRALVTLFVALHQRMQGFGLPRWLGEPHTAGGPKIGGHTYEIIVGHLVAAHDFLTEIGFKPAAAAELISREVRSAGVSATPDGKPINPKRIRDWRYRVDDGHSPALRKAAFLDGVEVLRQARDMSRQAASTAEGTKIVVAFLRSRAWALLRTDPPSRCED